MNKGLVGCAGWSVPGQHRHLFGEGVSTLARYATRFPVVEINSSFYRSHRQGTYARWAASVPKHFRFSVKMPKAISHDMALRGTAALLDRFLGEAGSLDDKLGAVLLQLPPSQPLDLRIASTFFRMYRRRTDAPLVCEPRHRSWFSKEAEALFERHAVTRVSADPPIATSDGVSSLMQRASYWRLHGKPRMYYSSYPDAELRQLAAAVRSCRSSPTAPWVIFDNTALGFAVANAARLQDMLRTGFRPEPVTRQGCGA